MVERRVLAPAKCDPETFLEVTPAVVVVPRPTSRPSLAYLDIFVRLQLGFYKRLPG